MAAEPAAPERNHSYAWEEAFCEAILETSDERLAERLSEARAALQSRRLQIAELSQRRPELLAIERALRGLDVLEQERLSSPPDVAPQQPVDDLSELCRKAATEKDPEKLTAVIAQINVLLRSKNSEENSGIS